jgi:ATP-binding cassette subfamily B protein
VGIVGSTGSGKSTLLNILMGLLHPTSGKLIVDGENIDYISSISWRKKIAYVPQDIFLSDATIAENIALGTPSNKIDFERVYKAAKMASIYEDIVKWPEGFNTRVGERGVNLSGGQKQRIGISRALYKNPEVLIFDEATSALDNKTENNVMQSIDSLENHLTIIMVAHRLETLRNCNIIIELDKGSCKSIKTNNGI